jgi:hypothetical protein
MAMKNRGDKKKEMMLHRSFSSPTNPTDSNSPDIVDFSNKQEKKGDKNARDDGIRLGTREKKVSMSICSR